MMVFDTSLVDNRDKNHRVDIVDTWLTPPMLRYVKRKKMILVFWIKKNNDFEEKSSKSSWDILCSLFINEKINNTAKHDINHPKKNKSNIEASRRG